MLALDSGDKIQGDASTASKVDYTISGLDSGAVKQLADGQLADSTGDLFTADSADAVATITLCNTHSAAITVNLYLTPSGGTARRIVPKDLSLAAGYSMHTDGKTLAVITTSGTMAAYGLHADTHKDGGSDEILLHELGEPTAAVDMNDQELQNHILHKVDDSTARDALNAVIGKVAFQSDTTAMYICTSDS